MSAKTDRFSEPPGLARGHCPAPRVAVGDPSEGSSPYFGRSSERDKKPPPITESGLQIDSYSIDHIHLAAPHLAVPRNAMLFSLIVTLGTTLLTNAVPTRRSPVPPTSVWDRSVHYVYALSNNYGAFEPPVSDQQFLDAFDEAQVTALVPFFLNVNDTSPYEDFIQAILSRNITIVPGIGRSPNDSDLDTEEYRSMARATKPYTDYLRLENLQGFYDEHGSGGIQSFIDYCLGLGYKHIMMNPWPTQNGTLVDFPNPELDSSFEAVVVRRESKYVLEDSPDNWHIKTDQIDRLRAFRQDFPVLINYESPGPTTILTYLEGNTTGASIEAFNVTVNDILGPLKDYDLHWAPPLLQTYNGIGLGTWGWIAQALKRISDAQSA